MNKATKARKEAMKTTTTMIRDGVAYRHNPATIGHDKHTAECWTVHPEWITDGPQSERAAKGESA